MLTDEQAITRCLQLGKNALGSSRPNPMVGAIIVYKDRIIGEGFTSSYGGTHAEVNAINSVKEKELLPKATLYVTLEPCSHFGKTPPCADLIVKEGIQRVVIGCLDDNPLVAGKGVERMRAAGISVTVGVLEKDCKRHHQRFFTFLNKRRPYIILKWAETADGYIAPTEKSKVAPVWISNSFSRQLTHKWRAQEQAILVGGLTVVADNPSLTVRSWGGHHPERVILSSSLQQSNYKIFSSEATTWQHTGNLDSLMETLYEKQINSLIVEGGSKTLQSFLDSGLWDEARVISCPVRFNKGILAPIIKTAWTKRQEVDSDILYYHFND
jgi:diaminohydroxyphosphoribosylaminopyrimidine deaminase/5-amino-6-(5-phosphoribosylamino)uracil reductase